MHQLVSWLEHPRKGGSIENRNKISPALLAPSQATDNVANAQGKENVQV